MRRLVESVGVPVVGNGDILTWFEAEDRRASSGCVAVMIGRGALIKPWLFREIKEGAGWEPTARERVEVYARLVEFMKEHFYDDDRGRKRAMRFLPWHFGFFCRYRPLPAEEYRAASTEHPLIQTRLPAIESEEPLDQLLQDAREEVHVRIADELWDAADAEDAAKRLEKLAGEVGPPESDYGEVAVAHG